MTYSMTHGVFTDNSRIQSDNNTDNSRMQHPNYTSHVSERCSSVILWNLRMIISLDSDVDLWYDGVTLGGWADDARMFSVNDPSVFRYPSPAIV